MENIKYVLIFLFLYFSISKIGDEAYTFDRIKVNNKACKMFYIYFPSKSQTQNTPLVIWLNGMIGLSNMFSLIEEIGPFRIDHLDKVSNNQFGWNLFSDLLLVELLGNGYSPCAVSLEEGSNTIPAADDILDLLVQLTKQYPRMNNQTIYLASEHLGTKIMLNLGLLLLRQKDPNLKFVLGGILLVNPIVSPVIQYKSLSYFIANSIGLSFTDFVRGITTELTQLLIAKTEDYSLAYNWFNHIYLFVHNAKKRPFFHRFNIKKECLDYPICNSYFEGSQFLTSHANEFKIYSKFLLINPSVISKNYNRFYESSINELETILNSSNIQLLLLWG